MFPALLTEVEDRFDAIDAFFDGTKKLGSSEAVLAKGLVFVLIYAVYEYTINQTVSEAIESIKAHRPRVVDLLPSLLTLFLDPELRSLRDVPRRNEWDRRLRLLERAFSRREADLSSVTSPPTDGSHYRGSHLQLIFKVFGINRIPAPRRRHMQRISEVVDHRNAIAHGREAPEDVGRRYTRSEIAKAIRQMRGVCLLWIRVFDNYCADRERHLR